MQNPANRIVATTLGLCLTMAALAHASTDNAPPRKPRGAAAQESVLASPNGRLAVTVSDALGLIYRISMAGRPVLVDSKLGMEFEGGAWIGPSTRIVKTTRSAKDSTWENHFGKRRNVRDHYNEMRLDLVEEGTTPRPFALIVRAYDDGIALRYDLPAQPGFGDFVVLDEATEFAFAENYRCWGGNYSDCVECNYPQRRLADITTSAGRPSVLPVLVELPNGYCAIAESDLIDWAGMFLTRSGPDVPEQKRPALKVALARRHRIATAASSPRRRGTARGALLMLASQAADLIASDLIANLATPSQIADTSWIKPGVTAWDPWWAGSKSTRGNTQADKPYIDLAGAMNWSYQLVDWGWYKEPDVTVLNGSVNVPELRDYAKQRGVQLLLWMHHRDLNRTGVDQRLFHHRLLGHSGREGQLHEQRQPRDRRVVLPYVGNRGPPQTDG